MTNPLNWLIGFALLVVVIKLVGRRDRYEMYHREAAFWSGAPQPPANETRGVTLNDAVQLASFVIILASGAAGWMSKAPSLFGVAVCAFILWVVTLSRSFTEYKAEARRDGIELQDAHGGRWGFILTMLAGAAVFLGVVVLLLLLLEVSPAP